MRVNSLGPAAPGRPDCGAMGRGGGSFDPPAGVPGILKPGDGGRFGLDPGTSSRLNNSVKSPPPPDGAGAFDIGAIGGADGGGDDWSTGGITESKRATPGDNDGRPPDRLGGCVGGAIGGGGAESLPKTPVKLSPPGDTGAAGGLAGGRFVGAGGAGRGGNDGGGANDGWRAAGGGSGEGTGGGAAASGGAGAGGGVVDAPLPGTTVGVNDGADGADGAAGGGGSDGADNDGAESDGADNDGAESGGADAGGGVGADEAAAGGGGGGVTDRGAAAAGFAGVGIPWKTRVNSPGAWAAG
jgi:hypothetical protein